MAYTRYTSIEADSLKNLLEQIWHRCNSIGVYKRNDIIELEQYGFNKSHSEYYSIKDLNYDLTKQKYNFQVSLLWPILFITNHNGSILETWNKPRDNDNRQNSTPSPGFKK